MPDPQEALSSDPRPACQSQPCLPSSDCASVASPHALLSCSAVPPLQLGLLRALLPGQRQGLTGDLMKLWAVRSLLPLDPRPAQR